MDLWGSGAGPSVGVYSCNGGRDLGQQWIPSGKGFKTAAPDSSANDRCLTNGVGGRPGQMTPVHVYSDLPTVELFINGKSQGEKSMLNPQLTPTKAAKSWAEYDTLDFEVGNLTAAGKDSSGEVQATHTVLTSGAAAAIVLSLDAPSVKTGTGEALLLDGQDVALVRATIVDGAGQLVADATNNVTFSVTSGPARIVGAHNGDPQCHEPNQVKWHSAYHGLVRCMVMVTEDKSSDLWHRARLAEIDVETGLLTQIAPGTDDAATPIVLQASADGLPGVSITIPTSTSASAGVMAVAAASAGKPVTFD